jgi:hypothetical protein
MITNRWETLSSRGPLAQVLLPMSALMSRAEADEPSQHRGVRVFGKTLLEAAVQAAQWDRVRLFVRQQYKPDVCCGKRLAANEAPANDLCMCWRNLFLPGPGPRCRTGSRLWRLLATTRSR